MCTRNHRAMGRNLGGLLLAVALGGGGISAVVTAASVQGLPDWFEGNRVQAHNEHSIEVAVAKAPFIHDVIHDAGARVLTRIILNADEGAWWPSAVGETHELARDRDVAVELIEDLHGRGMKMIGYFRMMSDAQMERTHPDWICRDWDGGLAVEPRGRRRKTPPHVLCLHSPYKDYIKTRLVELAHRGLDVVYFDSWHMPSVCACEYTRRAYEAAKGERFPFAVDLPETPPVSEFDPERRIVDGFETYAPGSPLTGESGPGQYSAAYFKVSDFVGETLKRTFREWREAAREVKPDMFFAIGSSLYPCFDTQPHMTDDFLEIIDTSKTEFHKPFGGAKSPLADEPDFAEPAWDVQTALGWAWTRDSCEGRPPLMWIPYVTEEKEARYSSGAAVGYGCVASLAFRVINRRAMEPYDLDHRGVFGSSFEVGQKVSPHLAHARVIPWAVLHISERARNRRLADETGLWKDVFAPVLGAFQALKEDHLPVATLTDKALAEGRIDPATKVLVLPWPEELSIGQRRTVADAEKRGLVVVRLDHGAPWHRASKKGGLMRGLVEEVKVRAGRPPIRISGPAAMHAVSYRHPESGKLAVCLMNSWGWYRTIRPGPGTRPEDSPLHISRAQEPSPCRDVTIEIDREWLRAGSVREVIDEAVLKTEETPAGVRIHVPEFQINQCVIVEKEGR